MISKKFQTEYAKLNKEQKEAVDTIEGPVMVIAGPGTGKTQILAMRIANILIKGQVNPSNILALTFTNSGVHAMKTRLLDIIGPASYQVHVHTFHSFCNEVINTFPEKFLTAKKINQLDDLEKIELIQKILDKHNFKFIKPLKAPYHYQRSILSSISKLKQENFSPENFINLIKKELNAFWLIEDLYHEKGPNKDKIKSAYQKQLEDLNKNNELAVVYKEFQETLLEQGKYDFDDMILNVVSAFGSDSELLSYYQEKFQYILVDEYQDTNNSQNKVVELIASFYDEPNVFVVGDDEQSIYRFQGASLENILSFRHQYQKAKIIILKENYRSGQNILDVSRSLIEKNEGQIFQKLKISKNLNSNLQIKGDISIGEFSNGQTESYFITKKIQELIKEGVSPLNIAVIYRENKDVEELVENFSKNNIPYRLEIGENVLVDIEIKKIITFLKAVDIHSDEDRNNALLEVMHYPFVKLSPLEIYKLTLEARKRKISLFDALIESENKAVDKFSKLIFRCQEILHQNTFATAFQMIIEESGYLEYLLKLPGNVQHLNRLQALYSDIKQVNVKEKSLNLKKFLERLNLLEENNISIKEEEITADFEGINLMTAHKAKGLEFDHVFIMRFIDKKWGNKAGRELIKLPNILKSKEKISDEIEEERRLFYVALTRAKKSIYVTYGKKYGDDELETLAIPSIFLSEIESSHSKIIDPSVIEKEFEKRIKLSFEKKKWQNSKAFKDFVKQIISEFKLNPTALNSYLECPRKFFYDHILKVPKAKDFNQSYGTAVHSALEDFFKKYRLDGTMPNKSVLLNFFENALNEEIFKPEEIKRALETGKDNLSLYFDFYNDEWKSRGVPISCELNFTKTNVHFDDIPITGVIDKIELIDSLTNKVRIIDYKTASPKSQNYLMGLTKEKDTSYLYQAYFYKLLTECDPSFNWQIGEIIFDFVSPEKEKFRRVSVPIDNKAYDEFKELVKKTYKEISKLKFDQTFKNCKKKDRICDYLGICSQ